MNRYRTTSSTQIYNEQIDNYIQTGEGYKQLRLLLLKQINQIDSDNQNADDTLYRYLVTSINRVPTLMENLRKKLLVDSAQQKSRTIDVLEDVITYADQVVQSYVISEPFCITLNTAISYKFFNPFTKSIFDENRLRLMSILIYYQNKFLNNQNKYYYISKTVRQLKDKLFQFPVKTYLIVPKVNQFKRKVVKKQQEKNEEGDKVGVTFQSIVEFVKDCQIQFNNNKNSCANTQFVRALKVKAKTLYDLSQNTQGLDLKPKEKQHAKQLYKQIRNMLKQIEKISEQKIKQQKIKNQKQFTEAKIQHMTPKKEKSGDIRPKQVETSDLLANVFIPTNEGAKSPQSMKKVKSLLDDTNNDEEFTDFVSANIHEKSIKKQVSSPVKQDGPKPLKKPPKYENVIQSSNLLSIDSTNLIQRVQQVAPTSQKRISTNQQPTQLIETFTERSSYSKKSLHSQHSKKGVKQVEQRDITTSNNNIADFHNEQHFSRFQIVNTLASKVINTNTYNIIPHDIDFSDSSSQSGNRVTFQTNKNQHFFDEQHKNHQGYLTPKKQLSQHERVSEHLAKSQKEIEKLASSENYQKQTQQQQSQLIANVNFGILADLRQVKPYDYSNVNIVKSPSNLSQDEQKIITLTPQSIKHQQLIKCKDEDEFEQYQQVEQTVQVKEITKQSMIDKLVSKLQEDDSEILSERQPQKGELVNINESLVSKNEPLL